MIQTKTQTLPKSILFISGLPLDRACVRYRCEHFQEQLASVGISSTIAWIADPVISLDHDLIILHRVEYDDFAAKLIAKTRALGKILIFETDDLIFDPDFIRYRGYKGEITSENSQRAIEEMERWRRTLMACDCCVVSTEFLAGRIEQLGKEAFVVHNAFSEEELKLARNVVRQPVGTGGRIVIGYMSGTPTHSWDFAEAGEAVADIMRRHRHVYLQITGPLQLPKIFMEFGHRVRLVPLLPWRQCYQVYGSLDINLAPLEIREPFCQGKSEIKYVEAAMVGVPTVASPTDAFRRGIIAGTTGLLAANYGEWVTALESLVNNLSEIERLGSNARDYVLEEYSPAKRSRELLTVIRTILERIEQRASGDGFSLKRGEETLIHREDLGLPYASRCRMFPTNLATIKLILNLVRRAWKYEGCYGLLKRLVCFPHRAGLRKWNALSKRLKKV
jgi:glycosyltransferase involved in cell wall biosynthesis